jgi:hypothetical protein
VDFVFRDLGDGKKTRVIVEAWLGEISAVDRPAVPGSTTSALDERCGRLQLGGFERLTAFASELASAQVMTNLRGSVTDWSAPNDRRARVEFDRPWRRCDGHHWHISSLSSGRFHPWRRGTARGGDFAVAPRRGRDMRSIFGLIASRLFPSAKPPSEDRAPFAVSLWPGGEGGKPIDDWHNPTGRGLPAQRDDFS